MLGKRKREAVVVRREDNVRPTSTTESTDRTTSEIFRKHFEAAFIPITKDDASTSDTQEDDGRDLHIDPDEPFHENDDSDSAWSGISGDEEQLPVVEVVDHAVTFNQTDANSIDKIFHKSFMGPRPPRELLPPPQSNATAKPPDADDIEDSTNLKHDLDLQRLLKESHLLEQTKQKSDGAKQRHKATDMRLQSLGSRVSLFSQQKMPMAHRKGILSKVSSKDAQRRKDAKENGIVLERTSKKPTASGPRRDRGVDVPVVGKFKGGTLQLSRKDVAAIQGPRRGGSKRGRR